MRIRTTKTKNGRLFYVIKTYYDANKKEHSVTVAKLGNENDIRVKHNCDPDVWAKEYVAKLNEKEKKALEPVQISFSKTSLISKNYRYSFNIGYLFLQCLYYQLGLDNICKDISKRRNFNYDLNDVLSRLVYGRILSPSSKLATHKFSKSLLEQPKFDEHHVYRALDVLADESDFIQAKLFSNSFAMGKRHCGIIYYDCTNFFFELEEQDENGLRKYGRSKENRPLPIVEMGMFIDADGIPLAMCINPGNTNEQTTLKPLEMKLISNYHMSKFVVCTDAGLASKANRKFNDLQDRAFVVTQSIKKLKTDIKEWALDSNGWKRSGAHTKKLIDISQIDEEKDYDTVFYKEQWIDQGSFEEKIIVTYSVKYREYHREIRNKQIDHARDAIKNGSVKRRGKNQNDYKRFIEKITVTDDGEVAENCAFILDEERIMEEERYDGFYAVVSNLDDDPQEIIKVNKMRWKIEECFRIMKSDFKARPVYVQRENRIKAHFITCFISLIIYRYLEKAVGHQYTCDELIRTLCDMNVMEAKGEGYIPTYMRTGITDALHEAFNLRTDYQIITKPDMKKILRDTKKRTRHAKS